MSEPGGHRLVVLRHAKAVHQPGLQDSERPLTDRGERDAAAAGEWLHGSGLVPDLVLCSPALRTRQTWQHASAGLPGPAATCDRRLWEASADSLLSVVRETPEEVRLLLLVGHNPASHQLVSDLTGECDAFPTAAIAVIALPGGWADAAPGAGTLTGFWSPRG